MTNTSNDNFYNRPNMEFVCSVHSQPVVPDGDEIESNQERCELTDVDQVSTMSEQQPASSTSCRPVPSIRTRRKRFTIGCSILTLGLLVISFSIPQRNEIVVPGGLTTKHGQLLSGFGTKRCAHCHGAGEKPFYAWLTDAVTGGSHLKTSQSDLCLKCHENLKGPNALLAHTVSTKVLKQIRERQMNGNANQSSKTSFASFQRGHTLGEQIACAKCHKEHHGSQHDLTAMTDAQCQSCHQKHFASFESGHPPFKNYLAGKRRSRIAFDHASHFGKHFPAKGQSFNCAQCHQDDDYQNVKKLMPFEQSCASCHDQPIRNSVAGNLKVFSLPMLDVDAFQRIGADIGNWPEDCVGDCDGSVSEVAQMLLSTDADVAKAFQKLGPGFDFSEIDLEDADQLRAAQTVVLGMKKLFREIALEGQSAIQKRLDSMADDQNLKPTTTALATYLASPTVKKTIVKWFPEMVTEKTDIGQSAKSRFHLAAHRQEDDGQLAVNPLKGKMGDTTSSRKENGDNTIANSSNKQENRAATPRVENVTDTQDKKIPGKVDNPFSQKLAPATNGELLAENPLKSLRSIPSKRQTDPTPNKTTDVEKQQKKSPKLDEKKVANQFSPAGDGDLLAKNPLKEEFLKQANGSQSPKKQNPGGNVSSTTQQPKERMPESSEPKTAQKKPAISKDAIQKFLEQNKIAADGNWVVDHSTYSLDYQPTGHADRVLQSLLTLAAAKFEQPATKPLFEKLSNPTSVGLCASCHTIDQQPGQPSLIVNWKSIVRDPSVRGWTKFSHRPHLIQPQTSDCSSCHKLNLSADIRSNFVGFDPNVSGGNFEPVTIDNCMSCHQKGQAASGCTTCHSYHVGTKVILRNK